MHDQVKAALFISDRPFAPLAPHSLWTALDYEDIVWKFQILIHSALYVLETTMMFFDAFAYLRKLKNFFIVSYAGHVTAIG